MSLEELDMSEEELEEIAWSMRGYLKKETIKDFKRMCGRDLHIIA